MPGTTTQFKLGLFALAAVVALVATALAFGIRGMRRPTIEYHTYFDESAQGLDPGAPVKYRGVRIGNVAAISIAPDRKHVQVSLAIERAAALKLDLDDALPSLRTELVLQGITGLKFVDMDFVDPTAHPAPVLPFIPAPRYIPSRPSLLSGVVRDVPDLVHRATITIDKLGLVLDDVLNAHLGTRAAMVFGNVQAATTEMQQFLSTLNASRLPSRAAATLAKVDAVAAKLDRTLTGTDALVASAKRATDSFGDVGRSSRASTRELERTLEDVGEAARALRDFMDSLEREPDMLVKGKARRR